MVRKSRGPDHIREHVEKRGYKHNYMLYSKGAYYYDLPYWTFVHLAKNAGATVDLHRMAVADTFAIDRYLDENCLVEPEKPSRKESVREMKKRNKDVEKIKRLVAEGSKRWVRYDEGAILYSVGIHTFQKLAKDARACYKVGGVTLIDTQKLDKFIEAFEMEDDD